MLVNAVVKMQWVAPHRVSHRQTRSYITSIFTAAYLAAVNIEALQMHFTFCNNNNNNPPARITAREATEQKLNILLEWPYEVGVITMTLFWFVVAPYYQTLSHGDIISNLLVFSACTGIALQQYSNGPSHGS